MKGYIILKMTFHQLLSVMLDMQKEIGVEELTGFGMKNNLISISLANKCSNSFIEENNEQIFTYIHEFMRHIVRQSIKGESLTALNQFCKSTVSDEGFDIISKELGVNCNFCKILVK